MLRRRSSRSSPFRVHKPQGVLAPRVQLVGPDHFGIVAIDCAKARSKFFFADFYGTVLIPPTFLPHTQADFVAAIAQIRRVAQERAIADLVVAIERTGTYHRPVQDAFRRAAFDTRLVHPYASKHHRQPADAGNKTDDTDQAGIFRATVNGFGLLEPVWPDLFQQLQLLIRQRRDLVKKNARLRCQIQETLHTLMPGYAQCFEEVFRSQVALPLARQTGTAPAIIAAGFDGLDQLLRQAKLPHRRPTLNKILGWAQLAPPPPAHVPFLRDQLAILDDDRLLKFQQISRLERQSAALVARTPFLLLLAIPGINIVSAADFAGELGPIEHYANANRITGRAGLAPCRYQSDQVDRASGRLRPAGHRRLRNALMQIADNLANNNHYFQTRAAGWRLLDKDPRWIRVKIAKIFSRLAYAMIAGRQLFPHPCCRQRHAILDKLLAFHRELDTPMDQVMHDLHAAADQLPRSAHADEAKPLHERLQDLQRPRSRGPQLLAEILPIVLARLGVGTLQSDTAEELGPS